MINKLFKSPGLLLISAVLIFFISLGEANADIITSSGVWYRDGNVMKTNPATLDIDVGGDLIVGGSITAGSISLTGDLDVAKLTITSAAPTLAQVDSDATDPDEGFTIVSGCTDCTSGNEDYDVSHKAMKAGDLVEYIHYNADGALTLGEGGITLNPISQTFAVPVGWDVSGPKDDTTYSAGNVGDYVETYDANGSADSIMNYNFKKTNADDTGCYLMSRDFNPNNDATYDDCFSPTEINIFDENADSGDYAAVKIGFGTQPDAAVANYWDIQPFVIDTDGTTTEVRPFLRFDKDGNATDLNTMTEGSSIFGDDLQVGVNLFVEGAINFPSEDVGATCTTGDQAFDTGGATREFCYCYATDTWSCVSETTGAGPTD